MLGKCSEKFIHRSQVSEYASRARGSSSTMMSSLSMVRAVFLLARIVCRRQRRWVPTWLLPACCLYLLFHSSFLLFSSLFPTPYLFLPFSLLWARIEQVVDPAFGFV